MPDPADRELVVRTRSGDTEAFGEIVRRYQGSVFNVCLRMMGERFAAEDMAQEAFIRAFQRLDRYDPDRPFGPWIRTVAANLCLNQLKRAGPVQVALEDERDQPLRAGPGGPEQQLQGRQAVELMRAAIAELPPHYRAVIELRHYQEMSYAEIARSLGLPLSDVKSHLYRARRSLARKLDSDE